MSKLLNNILIFSLVFPLCTGAWAEGTQDTETTQAAKEVQSEISSQAQSSRNSIIQEAVDALQQTHKALAALDEGRTNAAMGALALAVGKLELVMARHPELALAPTSMTVKSRDLYATTAALEEAIDLAKKHLSDGKLQAARHILKDLGSEVVISLTNLPLATYPETIKAISPLIDKGQIEAAQAALQTALNTLVVTEHVIPLPIVRSQTMLTIAEALADQENLTEAQQQTLNSSVAAVREQTQLAELLGYGDKTAYRKVYKQLKQLEERLEHDAVTPKQFANTREAINQVWQS